MDIARIEEIIQIFEMISKHTHPYFSADMPPVLNFLRGFYWGCRPYLMESGFYRIYAQIQQERGWPLTPNSPLREMIERGFTEDEMAQEYLAIELETWKRLHRELTQKNDIETKDSNDEVGNR
jgi:hypothetical protein